VSKKSKSVLAKKAKPAKKAAPKKSVPKKSGFKAKGSPKKPSMKKSSIKKIMPAPTDAGERTQRPDPVAYVREPRRRSYSGEQSGDLQGLSRREGADSESVDELLEEGNAFEAEAVMGVEEAGNAEGQEVHTHEVPEDDVPAEYLDEEQ
jgi:hypothetical protein